MASRPSAGPQTGRRLRVFSSDFCGRPAFAAPARRAALGIPHRHFRVCASSSGDADEGPSEAEQAKLDALQLKLSGTLFSGATPDTIRNIVLLLTLFPLFTNYFGYEIVSALQAYIKEDFGLDNFGFAQLYTAYELPNVIMPLIDGAIIDRIGVRRGAYLGVAAVFLGVSIVCAGPYLHAYWLMLLGRVLFGVGSEGLNVAMDVVYAKWFSGRGMAFASGVGAFAGRLGDVVSFNSAPVVAERFGGYEIALFLGPLVAALSAAAMAGYGFFDGLASQAATTRAGEEPVAEEAAAEAGPSLGFGDSARELRDSVTHLPLVFWLMSGVCFCYYGTYYPFQAFAPEFMYQKFSYSPEEAARVTSVMGAVSMFLSPVAGYGIDKIGFRAVVAALCGAAMIPCILSLTLTSASPIAPMAIIGCFFSLVPAAVWPSIAVLVEPSLHGVAYGALTSAINIGLLASYFALGRAADAFGVTVGVPACVLALIAAGGLCAVGWNVVDARTGGLANASDDRISEILRERADEARDERDRAE